MFKKILFIFLILNLISCKKDYELCGKALFEDSNNKLWRHRVNEISDANKYLESFIGLELDVFFNKKEDKFYVAHDDDYDIDETITLEEYFSNVNNVDEHYYWIDVKNLNWLNDNKSLKRMIELLNKFNVKEKSIIESTNHKLLKKYNEEGIYTSYWVSLNDYNGILNEENRKEIKDIEDNLKECPHNALSSHYNNLEILTDHFPEQNLHLWTNGLIGEEDKELINNFKLFPNVKVIIIDYEEPF